MKFAANHEINSGRFINAFRRIETVLRKSANAAEHESFSRLVDKVAATSPLVSHHHDNLRRYARLRNAIVHESRGDRPLAEPLLEIVEEVEQLAAILEQPPTIPEHCYATIDVFSGVDSIGKALAYMRRFDYSQVAIRPSSTKLLALLSANTVTRWLGTTVKTDAPSLSTPIDAVMSEAESLDNMEVLPRDSECGRVISRFELAERSGRRLDAILITDNGKLSELPIGIVTLTDLPLLFSAIR